ncbi:dephospho-CoA kinase [Streptomyces sp. RFCAC02]|uniref:dephospho-CoA kinase n=1 Tax=Streptomyces sp. RFCAC02 TaxID=2499143 RepID=UPI0010229FA4|nr:dephospho-CoA kinase [Streptomyces sp. RFCAC02]
MLSVGLTGGIGAGKSEAVRMFAALGAVIVDSDAIAHEVVEPGTPGLAAVAAEFGTEVLDPDGALDRARLASVVFADELRLKALNAIVHPLVAQRSAELAAAAPADAIVLHDVPLLVENRLMDRFAVVVVVDADERTQLGRLTRVRGMSEADAKARMAAQASRAERLEHADFVLRNDGSLPELERQVTELWRELTALRERRDDPARGRG